MRKEKSKCPECGIYRNKFVGGICDPCFNRKRRLESPLTKCECDPNCPIMIHSIGYHGERNRYAAGHATKTRTGSKNPMWKGGIIMDGNGYLKSYKPNHPYCDNKGYKRSHIVVMEIYLSIKYGYPVYINPSLDVHHINGVKIDNRPSNLQILTPEQHGYIHGKNRLGKKYKKSNN